MHIPDPTNPIVDAINAHHEQKPNKSRAHFGISMIGMPCKRRQWLTFRWAFTERIPGQTMRLFRRGNMEESIATEDLRAIGVDLREVGNNQRFVKLGGHVSGSIDGIIYGGVPGAERSMHIWENKTHNKKSFDDLEKNGVQKSKPEHYDQMQGYMLASGIERALYYATCKDDDRLYTERVKLDLDHAEKIKAEAIETSLMDQPPPPISTDSSWYQCKFCPAHDLCHGSKKTKNVNCRTCAHSTAKPDGTWHCARWDAEIPTDAQLRGCDSHVLHPDLVPWKMDGEKCTKDVAAYIINGKTYVNGEGNVSSREMVVDGFGNPGIMAVREMFHATLGEENGA